MDIGLYCNWNVKVVSNGFYLASINAKYLNQFKKHSKKVVLLSNITKSKVLDSDIFVSFEDVELIKINPFSCYYKAFREFFTIKKGIQELCSKVTHVYTRTPEPFSWLLGIYKKNTVINYHFTSNPIEIIRNEFKSNKIKALLKFAIFYPEYLAICFSARCNLATTNGSSILPDLPFFLKSHVTPLIESSIIANEINHSNKNNIHADNIKFLCVSRLQEGKGLELLIDAFTLVLANNKNVTLSIVGDGPLFKRLTHLILKNRIEDKIKLLGFVPNGNALNKIYQSHNFFINPSLSETGPRVIIEAMMNNLYCVSTDVGYVSEVLTNAEGVLLGSIIKDKDKFSLTKELEYCIRNHNDLISLANMNGNLATKHTLDAFISNIINVLKG